MNKVFKVIWSEARNAYVVVSEIAKNHGSKSCSTKKLLAMLIATGVMTCASMAPAMAADPPAEALKHNTVAAGYNITVTPKDNSDGGKEYKVDLKNDIHLAGDDPDALVGISGSKGTIWATGRVTVGSGVDGSVVMDGTTATVSGLGNTTTAYDDFANGKGKAATEEQLKEISEVAENANQGWNLSTNGGEASKVAPGETVDFSGDKNINISNDGTKVKVELKNDIYLAGDDPNAFVNISGSKGTIWASGSVTAGSVVASDNDGNYSEITPKSAKLGQVTIDEKGNIAGVNSLQTNALNAKYNLSVGTANADDTVPFFVNSNGAFYAANGKLVVDKDGKLVAPEAELGKVTADEGEIGNVVLKDGVFYKHTALRDGELFVGDASGNYSQITTKGAKLGKVTVAEDGKISGVAAGAVTADSKDAVNGSQLYKTNQEVVNNTNRINKLGSRVNKVGAGAAALAALHPMDFDPDDKLTFSAGYGNYAGENAAAIGAYYRPDEKVMFSVAGTVGNGENMVNAGVSFALDRTNHVSNSRTALAREVIDLRGQLAVMGAKMAKMEKAFGMLDETKTKLFPDVPANHWAYEYIAKLAGNGYIEGYPDGNFGGDRLMTRYEFAAMLYRAIENGAALEEKIIKEFEPELGRIRVDRISGEDGDRDKIERVRVNDTKGERDHYGNKLAK